MRGGDDDVCIISFRDPEGAVAITREGPVIRNLSASGVHHAQRVAELRTVAHFQSLGGWIPAVWETSGTALRHPRVFFPSYAHEWPPSALAAAGRLTLKLTHALLEEGWELKDGTPTNVLFEGTRPVFVDHLSPAPRDPGQMGWRAYGQFSRTFLIPLLLNREAGTPLRWIFLAHRDGVGPEAARSHLRGLRGLGRDAFSLVTLPNLLGRWMSSSRPGGMPQSHSSSMGQGVTGNILKGLESRLNRLAPRTPGSSLWFDYQDKGISYTPEGLERKEKFITEVLAATTPQTLLDLGCNTGRYSKLAAQSGVRCVALDSDVECVDRLWREAEAEGLDIQPLVADLGRPAPRQGWGYVEEASLWERLEGRFDLTLALALIHHLLVRERIPLPDVLRFLAGTSRQHLVVEWVDREDPQFQRLAGPNSHLYVGCTLEAFRDALGKAGLGVLRQEILPGCPRTLFLLERL